ncbi:hypothetical protein F5Y15DRAFT_63788 [Xylariaceae sp. FL0016]|nr:hypothetical protein F5Y15DRAFT_63788 [Xylariaceae sp. FL0016]
METCLFGGCDVCACVCVCVSVCIMYCVYRCTRHAPDPRSYQPRCGFLTHIVTKPSGDAVFDIPRRHTNSPTQNGEGHRDGLPSQPYLAYLIHLVRSENRYVTTISWYLMRRQDPNDLTRIGPTSAVGRSLACARQRNHHEQACGFVSSISRYTCASRALSEIVDCSPSAERPLHGNLSRTNAGHYRR